MAQVQYWACHRCGREILNDCSQKTIPRKYCDDCRDEMAGQKYKPSVILTKNCVYCGKEFTAKRSHAQYCSSLCNVRHKRKTVLTKTCIICNKNVVPFGRRKYCSSNCKLIGFHRMRLKRLEAKLVLNHLGRAKDD